MKKAFIIEVNDDRKYFCYNYGCNHWYLCIKAEYDTSLMYNMNNCRNFKNEEQASYTKQRID